MHKFSTNQNRLFWTANQASYFGSKNARWIVHLCRDVIGHRILDAGAGDGSLMRLLKAEFPESKVIGIDLAPKDPEISSGNLSDLPYGDGSFDTVFCSEVIEHNSMEDDRAILAELSRVLIAGGHLVLTTPYDERLEDGRVICPQCECVFHKRGHQLSFTEQDFNFIFQKAGLIPIRIFPVKMSRVSQFRFLGRNFFRSRFMAARTRRMHGKRTLIGIARKTDETTG